MLRSATSANIQKLISQFWFSAAKHRSQIQEYFLESATLGLMNRLAVCVLKPIH
jgi:hypothetical protein